MAPENEARHNTAKIRYFFCHDQFYLVSSDQFSANGPYQRISRIATRLWNQPDLGAFISFVTLGWVFCAGICA